MCHWTVQGKDRKGEEGGQREFEVIHAVPPRNHLWIVHVPRKIAWRTPRYTSRLFRRFGGSAPVSERRVELGESNNGKGRERGREKTSE